MIHVWKNGRKPPYMDSGTVRDLNADKALYAARCLSYEGLQFAAAGFLLAMNSAGLSPKKICSILEETDEKAGTCTAIRIPADTDDDNGGDDA
jgi:hypothetical protein